SALTSPPKGTAIHHSRPLSSISCRLDDMTRAVPSYGWGSNGMGRQTDLFPAETSFRHLSEIACEWISTVVLFEDVAVRYGAGPNILQNISFSLAPGSFHFLVGASGAGKSSLLKLMYLAMPPAIGLIDLFGRNVATLKRQDLPALRRRIGVVFQDFRL